MARFVVSRRTSARPWLISNPQYFVSLLAIGVLAFTLPVAHRVFLLIPFVGLKLLWLRRVKYIATEAGRRYRKEKASVRHPPYVPSMMTIYGAGTPERFLAWYERVLARQRAAYAQRGAATYQYLQEDAFVRQVEAYLDETEKLGLVEAEVTPELERLADTFCDSALKLEVRKRAFRRFRAAIDALLTAKQRPVLPAPPSETEEDRLLAKLAWARPQLNGPTAMDIDKLVETYRAMVAQGERRMKKRLYSLRQASDILDRPDVRKVLRQSNAV